MPCAEASSSALIVWPVAGMSTVTARPPLAGSRPRARLRSRPPFPLERRPRVRHRADQFRLLMQAEQPRPPPLPDRREHMSAPSLTRGGSAGLRVGFFGHELDRAPAHQVLLGCSDVPASLPLLTNWM